MFANLGFAGTTTNKIAVRAGVSIGSLYQYFPNKRAILSALKKEHQRDIHPIIEDFLKELGNPGIPPEQALRNLFTYTIRQHELRPNLTRALTINQAYLSAETESDKSEDAVWLQKIIDALLQRDDFNGRNLELMGSLLLIVSGDLMRWIAHQAPASLKKSELIDEAVRMISRYLE
jgi:AcrR family transcriptional regulator